MVTWIINIGSGNGLLPDGTKPLPKPMLTTVIIKSVLWHASASNFFIRPIPWLLMHWLLKSPVHQQPIGIDSTMPQSHHTSGPHIGWHSRLVWNKNRTSTHGARTGHVHCRTNFASLCGAYRVLMHALKAYGPRTGLDIVNNWWTARADCKGPVQVLKIVQVP